MKHHFLALVALALAVAPELVFANATDGPLEDRELLKRDVDSYKIFNRKRNAHACIMSIVFLVLYPLGAISVHLPIDRIPLLRNSYLKHKIMAIHAPIQILGLVMMIGGLALGIRIAHDLGFFNRSVPAHMIIGLIVTLTIIIFQPVMGILQHRYFKRTGGKSVFAYIHRWIGRFAILLGMINNGLGFQLAENDIEIPTKSYVRNFTILGVLVTVWLGLVIYDEFFQKPQSSRKLADKTTSSAVKKDSEESRRMDA
ncbi:hypothetical protein TWF694_001427 [Orbilia ellipsospora]|uniref:Cytochrome b561 domain-containing protein n=1 Tax=Orbilia ellipsospora TaxID=2528407 RepID=A0AAV9XRK3_9PEZI